MKAIDDILTKQIAKDKTASVYYILFNEDTILHQFISGYADIKTQRKTNENTTFNAFSITKTFTALAILQLSEKGILQLDDSAKQYLPDFPYSKDITIRHLLTHSGGIPNPIPLSWIHLLKEHNEFKWNTFFEKIFRKHNKAKSKPNEKFSYSNLGYVILGQLIEKVSGLTYEEYVTKHILDIIDPTANELSFTIDTSRQAKGYHKKMSFSNLMLGFLMDKKKFMGKDEGRWQPFNLYYVNGASYGGLIATPNGLMNYIRALLVDANRMISKESKEMLFSENFTTNGKATNMCLSWFKGQLEGNNYYTHAGGGGGYYCEIRIYPKLKIGSVIMFNRSGMSDERFLSKLDKHYLGISNQ